MPLFLLTRKGTVGYDEFDSKLVRAENELEARKIANLITGYEGKIWTDHGKVECQGVLEFGKPGVIISDFNGGWYGLQLDSGRNRKFCGADLHAFSSHSPKET